MKTHKTVLHHCSIYFLTILMTLSACSDHDVSQKENSLREEKVTLEFSKPTIALPLAEEASVLFGIRDCRIYRKLSVAENEWSLLFMPAPYPLPQQCVRERLEYDGEYIQIEIGTQALGAGGCCTTYAAYRSKDGVNWEIRPATSINEWQALDAEPLRAGE